MNDFTQTAKDIAARLVNSDLYRNYRDAFLMTTGLRLSLEPVSTPRREPALEIPTVSRLRLPINAGQEPVAYLLLQPVAVQDENHRSFNDVARTLLDQGSSAAEVRAAREFYVKLTVVPAERLSALQILLKNFASQLSTVAENIFLQVTDNEPEPVRKARTFIMNHLTEALSLEEVSRNAGVSPFHFCKLFKRSTSLTFTDFVNRARIEHAKRLLLKPQSRVTEVAYDVGFQSLSQFNRSFRRVTAQSPTEYRTKMHLWSHTPAAA